MPIDAPETEVVTTWKVACDGGEGALGHPRVWLIIPADAAGSNAAIATSAMSMPAWPTPR